MKIKTLLVAPYRGLMELASGMALEQNELDLSMVHADLSEILPHLKQYEEEGYEIIISRGGTAKLISKYCSLPVIEIPVTGYDILRMLTLLKEYNVNLEMIGFSRIVEGFISVSNVMDFEIPHTIIHHESEVEPAVQRAKERGVAIIVGDSIAVRVAEQFGLQGILITSGREAITEAFNQTRQIYGLLSKYKRQSDVCKQMMDQLDIGTGQITDQGQIQFANAAFYRLLGVNPQDSEISLFERSPYLKKLLKHVESNWSNQNFEIYDASEKFKLKAEVVEDADGGRVYNVILNAAKTSDDDMILRYVVSKYESLLSWVIGTTEFMRGLLADIGTLTYPITINGKKGTRKIIYAQAIHASQTESGREFIEIKTLKGSEEASYRLKELLAQADTSLFLTGFECYSPALQRGLIQSLQKYRGQLMFGFEEPLKVLYEQGKLDEKLFVWLKKNGMVSIPDLQETQDFDAIVRSMIVKYNERYGKQIVGIRPEVIESLRSHAWNGDIVELNHVIRELVKRSEGEYVEVACTLSVLQEQTKSNSLSRSSVKQLDLKQPLKHIVKEIIHFVLEEENMNQSKAAERLGINRTTLWSKLKEES